MAEYTPVLEIIATHAYYASGRASGLRMTPTADTTAWLREVNGLCRDTGSGVLVLGDTHRLGLSAARPQGLSWLLRCGDSRFAAVTAGLPVHPRSGGSWAGAAKPLRNIIRHKRKANLKISCLKNAVVGGCGDSAA